MIRKYFVIASLCLFVQSCGGQKESFSELSKTNFKLKQDASEAEDEIFTNYGKVGTFFLPNASTFYSEEKNGSSCSIEAGVYQYYGEITVKEGKKRVILAKAPNTCTFNKGFIQAGDIADHVITIPQDTVFKATKAQSSSLPSTEKCFIKKGIYKLNAPLPAANDRHYKIEDSSVFPYCTLDSGYFFVTHLYPGIAGITVTKSTVLKKHNRDSSTLPADQLCNLSEGTYTLKTPFQPSYSAHYKVTLADEQIDCPFKQGFIFSNFTNLDTPDTVKKKVGFMFPLVEGSLGSQWCVCRNVGTSPHIGQDLVKYGVRKSVAVRDGVVKAIEYDYYCGYGVVLQDETGATWRYLHLNRPNFTTGTKLKLGDEIGFHSSYPRSGCGTGPHLHFERRTSGLFSDAPTGKTCQYGYRSCYYDPIKPWRGDSFSFVVPEGDITENSGSQLESSCNPMQPKPTPVTESPWETLTDSTNSNLRLKVSPKITKKKFISLKMGLSSQKDGANNCSVESECIVSWTAYSEDDQGAVYRVIHDQSARNKPINIIKDQQICLPHNHKKLIIVANTAAGESLIYQSK